MKISEHVIDKLDKTVIKYNEEEAFADQLFIDLLTDGKPEQALKASVSASPERFIRLFQNDPKFIVSLVNKGGALADVILGKEGLKDAVYKDKDDGQNYTFLMVACINKMEFAAFKIIRAGARLDPICINGINALMFACKAKLINPALMMIQAGAPLGQVTERSGNTALILACMKGLADVALSMVDKSDAKLDHVNRQGYNAVIVACLEKMNGVAIAIVEKGARLDILMKEKGTSVLTAACGRGLADVALKIIEKLTSRDQLNHANTDGNTPLILACRRRLTDVALELIDKGAQVDMKNKNGMNARRWAVRNEMKDVLLKLG